MAVTGAEELAGRVATSKEETGRSSSLRVASLERNIWPVKGVVQSAGPALERVRLTVAVSPAASAGNHRRWIFTALRSRALRSTLPHIAISRANSDWINSITP